MEPRTSVLLGLVYIFPNGRLHTPKHMFNKMSNTFLFFYLPHWFVNICSTDALSFRFHETIRFCVYFFVNDFHLELAFRRLITHICDTCSISRALVHNQQSTNADDKRTLVAELFAFGLHLYPKQKRCARIFR